MAPDEVNKKRTPIDGRAGYLVSYISVVFKQ